MNLTLPGTKEVRIYGDSNGPFIFHIWQLHLPINHEYITAKYLDCVSQCQKNINEILVHLKSRMGITQIFSEGFDSQYSSVEGLNYLDNRRKLFYEHFGFNRETDSQELINTFLEKNKYVFGAQFFQGLDIMPASCSLIEEETYTDSLRIKRKKVAFENISKYSVDENPALLFGARNRFGGTKSCGSKYELGPHNLDDDPLFYINKKRQNPFSLIEILPKALPEEYYS